MMVEREQALWMEMPESAANRPRQTMFGEELYPSIFAKAALLGYLLIKNPPFADGDKRTGLHAMLRFLEISGFTIDIAASKLDKEQIEEWLRIHTVPVS